MNAVSNALVRNHVLPVIADAEYWFPGIELDIHTDFNTRRIMLCVYDLKAKKDHPIEFFTDEELQDEKYTDEKFVRDRITAIIAKVKE